MAELRPDCLEGSLLVLLSEQGSNALGAQLRTEWVQVPLSAREFVTQTEFAAMREVFSKLRNRSDEQKAIAQKARRLRISRAAARHMRNGPARTSVENFELDSMSQHVHELIGPMSVLSAMRNDGPGASKIQAAHEARMRQVSSSKAPSQRAPTWRGDLVDEVTNA